MDNKSLDNKSVEVDPSVLLATAHTLASASDDAHHALRQQHGALADCTNSWVAQASNEFHDFVRRVETSTTSIVDAVHHLATTTGAAAARYQFTDHRQADQIHHTVTTPTTNWLNL